MAFKSPLVFFPYPRLRAAIEWQDEIMPVHHVSRTSTLFESIWPSAITNAFYWRSMIECLRKYSWIETGRKKKREERKRASIDSTCVTHTIESTERYYSFDFDKLITVWWKTSDDKHIRQAFIYTNETKYLSINRIGRMQNTTNKYINVHTDRNKNLEKVLFEDTIFSFVINLYLKIGRKEAR